MAVPQLHCHAIGKGCILLGRSWLEAKKDSLIVSK